MLTKKYRNSPCFVFAPLVRGTPCLRSGIPEKEGFTFHMVVSPSPDYEKRVEAFTLSLVSLA